MKTTTRRIDAAGVQLNVVTLGDARQVPLVLVHGYPDNHRVWLPVAERLAKQYFVILYDVRGAGESGAPEGVRHYALDVLAEDLAAVVDAVIPGRRFHLVGHDWGSIQSWESVTTARLKPRIASYTTISGPCLDHVAQWLRERLTSVSAADKARLLRQMASSWYIGFFQLPVLPVATWRHGMGSLWPAYLEKREGVAEAAPNPTQAEDGAQGVQLYRANFRQRLLAPQPRPAACPVQLIVPTRDNYASPALYEDLHRHVPALYRRDIEASHWVPLSHPDRIAGWVADFVAAVEGNDYPPALQRARVQPERRALPLAGKLAVITGAGSGIGRATALRFAGEGADLVCVDINAAAAERSAELCRLLGARAWARRVDVGSDEAMTALAQEVGHDFGGADIVVNNAGIGMAGGVMDTSTADWSKLLHVNLWGVIHGSRLFAQQMVEQGRRGHIVNVASAAAFAPSRQLAAYSTSKAAVHMLTECLRAELAGHGIGVTALCPGFVATGIAGATVYAGLSEEEQARKRAKADALYKRRNFAPEEVAAAVFAAVQENPPLALVGAEAWITRLMSRFAPGLSRLVARADITP